MLGRYTPGPRPVGDDSSRPPNPPQARSGCRPGPPPYTPGHDGTLRRGKGREEVAMAFVGRQPGQDVLREHWALFTGVGAAMAILGVLALGNLWDATVVTTFIIGIVLILAGVAQIGFAFMAKEAGGLLRGITGAIGVL